MATNKMMMKISWAIAAAVLVTMAPLGSVGATAEGKDTELDALANLMNGEAASWYTSEQRELAQTALQARYVLANPRLGDGGAAAEIIGEDDDLIPSGVEPEADPDPGLGGFEHGGDSCKCSAGKGCGKCTASISCDGLFEIAECTCSTDGTCKECGWCGCRWCPKYKAKGICHAACVSGGPAVKFLERFHSVSVSASYQVGEVAHVSEFFGEHVASFADLDVRADEMTKLHSRLSSLGLRDLASKQISEENTDAVADYWVAKLIEFENWSTEVLGTPVAE